LPVRAGRTSRSAILRSVFGALLATATAGGAQTWTDPEGTASGTLTLNGVTTPLKFSYASPQPGFFDKQTEDIRILLSDVPLDDAVRRDSFALSRLARQDRAHIVEVIVDKANEPMTGMIYAAAFGGMVSLSGVHRFEAPRVERGRIEGRLHMRDASEFMKVRFQYEATFAAPIPRPPTAAEAAAALAGPAGDTARAYLSALRGNDVAAFRRTLSPEFAAQYEGTAGARKFAELRAETPADTRVSRVEGRRGGEVLVVLEGSTQGVALEFELTLVMAQGRWVVTR